MRHLDGVGASVRVGFVRFPLSGHCGTWLLVWLWLLGCGWVDLAAQTRVDVSEITVEKPSQTKPVTATMKVAEQEVRAGERVEVIVRVRIAGGHYIYSTNEVGGPFSPTVLTLTLPQELERVGELVAPEPSRKGGHFVYTNSVVFRQMVKVRLNTEAKTVSIKGELLCQACTEELCWPPRKTRLETTVSVLPKAKE